ncbi:MAG: cation diffusion facilitator family transporter, partial [Deltaproteobacteria bacterium]|nr:cation diffusion facilitator family transporter [Deltaproteobacteria bacterium]
MLGAAGKFAAGLASVSSAMVSSALDSLGDILVSAVKLWVVRFSDAPPDEEHNYRHARVEELGAMFEGGFIFAAGVVALFTAARRPWTAEAPQAPGLGLAVMVPVLAMTAGTVAWVRKVARETGSLVLKADALHCATDIWMNGGVFVSLLIVERTGCGWVDPVVSLGIGLFMLRAARGIVLEGFDVLLNPSLDRAQVERVEAILRA